jgi:hypothetical protein
MFAIKGKITNLTKCKSRNGGHFYRIILCKELKDKKLETIMEFFSFYETVNKKFDDTEIALNDIIEITFYIKGVAVENQIKNNLMVRNLTLIKKSK